jgi:hypothetical protein
MYIHADGNAAYDTPVRAGNRVCIASDCSADALQYLGLHPVRPVFWPM